LIGRADSDITIDMTPRKQKPKQQEQQQQQQQQQSSKKQKAQKNDQPSTPKPKGPQPKVVAQSERKNQKSKAAALKRRVSWGATIGNNNCHVIQLFVRHNSHNCRERVCETRAANISD
jgi:hypothetical protein